ncbi:hypothetical protein DSECCO2_588920 [anaerobic digester metagenome]
MGIAGVDVGRAQFEFVVAAGGDVLQELVLVFHVRRHERRHEGHGVMGLQVGRLVGDLGVGGAVGLVEAVLREFLHQVEDFVRLFGIDLVLGAAFHEDAALLGHFLGVFLAHGPAQQVAAAQGIVGQHLGDLHDLFLVDDDPVGRLQGLFQERVRIFDRVQAVLAADELLDHARPERPRAVEGEHGDQIFEAVGLEHAQVFAHALAFHLEDAVGVAPAEEFVGGRIGHGQGFEIGRLLPHFLDDLERVVDDRDGFETQEVELDESRLLHALHVPLGHGFVVFPLIERHVLGHGLVGDDHAGGVGGGVAGQAFQAARDVDEPGDARIGAHERLELGLELQRLVDGHLEVFGDELGDAVGLAEGHAERPAHVAHHALGLHGAEGGDLGHGIGAVVLGDVADDLMAAAFAEVHVDIGHAHALDIEEALEKEVVRHGVEVGDAQRIRHQRPGRRTAPRPDGDVVVLGPVDEVLDDEEIAREAHLLDDVELELQAVPVFLRVRVRHFVQALFEALAGHVGHDVVQGLAGRGLVDREMVVAELEREVDALGDLAGVGERLRHVGEGGGHLLGRAVVEVLGGEAHALFVVHAGGRLDAQQDVVGLGVVGVQVMAVVGGDERQLQVIGQFDQEIVDRGLLGDAVGLELEIEAVRKERHVLPGHGHGLVLALPQQLLVDLALEAGGQGNEALAVFAEQFLVHARLVVEALGVAAGHELEQVVVADHVLGEQHQMVARGLGLAVETAARGDVDLAADDGLEPRLLGVVVKNERAVEVAVVGDGRGGRAEGGGGLDEVADADGPVEEAVFGVAVQVDEIGHGAFRVRNETNGRAAPPGLS